MFLHHASPRRFNYIRPHSYWAGEEEAALDFGMRWEARGGWLYTAQVPDEVYRQDTSSWYYAGIIDEDLGGTVKMWRNKKPIRPDKVEWVAWADHFGGPPAYAKEKQGPLLYKGAFYRVADVSLFLDAAQQLKQKHPGLQLEIEDHDYLVDTVNLHNIRVRGTRAGTGSAVMQELVALADEHQVTIRAHAEPFGAEKMSLTKLKRWYKQFGFRDDGQNWMVRKPRKG